MWFEQFPVIPMAIIDARMPWPIHRKTKDGKLGELIMHFFHILDE